MLSDSRLRPYLAIARRSILGTARQPAAIIPSLTFPLIFLALSSAALSRATHLPGFPQVDSFLQFGLAASIVQGVLFGAVAAGTDMARDVENGFFERLIASPVSRNSIVVGRLAGAALLGFLQAWFFFGVAILFGADVLGGIPGMALVSIVCAVLAAAIGAVTVAMALKTGSSEAVQGSFPLIFSLLFLSSAFFPRALMEGWFKSAATINPLSHLIEGNRAQVIHGLDIGQFLIALGIAVVMFAFGLTIARLALRGRLVKAS